MSDQFSFIDSCRFCLNKNATITLQLSSEAENEVNLLLDVIKYCLGIELELEIPPKTICQQCKEKLEHFANFKKLCVESEENLQKLVKTEKTEESLKVFNNFEYFKEEISGDLNGNKESKDELDLNNDSLQIFSESLSNHDYEVDITSTDSIVNKKPRLKRKKNSKKLPKLRKRSYVPKKTDTYCNICHTDLGNAEKFTKHNSECHGVDKDGICSCIGCDKKFRTPKARASHELNFCKGLKDGYKCTICDRFLPRRGVYERHMRDHRKNVSVEIPEDIFYCLKCHASFKTKKGLKSHLDEHVKKQFICETCGRAFSRQDYLHKHKMTHTGARQYKCPHCEYSAAQKSTLNVHIRKHTGERPYSCHICSQRCVNRSNLRAHLRRHDGVKSFECTICQKKFGYKSSLDDHISSTHERSVPNICQICGALYTRLNGLRRHLAAKHGKKMQKSIQDKQVSLSDLNSSIQNKEVSLFDYKHTPDLNSVDKIIITQNEKDIYMKIVANDKDSSYVMKGDQIFVVQDVSDENT